MFPPFSYLFRQMSLHVTNVGKFPLLLIAIFPAPTLHYLQSRDVTISDRHRNPAETQSGSQIASHPPGSGLRNTLIAFVCIGCLCIGPSAFPLGSILVYALHALAFCICVWLFEIPTRVPFGHIRVSPDAYTHSVFTCDVLSIR